MTVTDLKAILEDLEKMGKGNSKITIEDEVSFLWDVDEVGAFRDVVYLKSSTISNS